MGVKADVYDVDARGRTAPDRLGVLEPLRRGHLVHGQRHRHAQSRPGGRHERRPARARRDPRVPLVPERRRQAPVHGRPSPPPVHVVGRRGSARSSTTRRARAPASCPGPRHRCPTPRSIHAGASACSARRTATGSGTCWSTGSGRTRIAAADEFDDDGNLFDIAGIDDPFAGLTWALRRPRRRRQPGGMTASFVIHQRHPQAGRVPAVQQLAVGPLGQAGRAVRAAHR